MRAQMSNADRAKQFLPFAALKGFDEAIEAAAIFFKPRILPGEDAQEELDRRLRHLKVGDVVTLLYYRGNGYKSLCGPVNGLDWEGRYLHIGESKIAIDDILRLTAEASE